MHVALFLLYMLKRRLFGDRSAISSWVLCGLVLRFPSSAACSQTGCWGCARRWSSAASCCLRTPWHGLRGQPGDG